MLGWGGGVGWAGEEGVGLCGGLGGGGEGVRRVGDGAGDAWECGIEGWGRVTAEAGVWGGVVGVGDC